jgi:hypothetical protein
VAPPCRGWCGRRWGRVAHGRMAKVRVAAGLNPTCTARRPYAGDPDGWQGCNIPARMG